MDEWLRIPRLDLGLQLCFGLDPSADPDTVDAYWDISFREMRHVFLAHTRQVLKPLQWEWLWTTMQRALQDHELTASSWRPTDEPDDKPAFVLGGSGYERAGKSTAAYLARKMLKRPSYEISFAGALKDLVRLAADLYHPTDAWVNGDLKETRIPGTDMTARYLLQRIGTEVGRDVFGPNVWIRAMQRRVLPGYVVVVPDARFHDEGRWILSQPGGGAVIEIDRPSITAAIADRLAAGETLHASVQQMRSFDAFTAVISNDSTRQVLFWRLAEVLSKTCGLELHDPDELLEMDHTV